jgi:ribonuclease T1
VLSVGKGRDLAVRNGVTAGSDGRGRLVLGVVLTIVGFGLVIAAVAGPLRSAIDLGSPQPAGLPSIALPTPSEAETSAAAPGSNGSQPGQSDLPLIAVSELPTEAKATLQLIEQGGPFPFSRDGVVFGNREGVLPEQPPGYYREYTVITPGAPDRGSRRIIVGEAGDRYYTSDNYASFREIER